MLDPYAACPCLFHVRARARALALSRANSERAARVYAACLRARIPRPRRSVEEPYRVRPIGRASSVMYLLSDLLPEQTERPALAGEALHHSTVKRTVRDGFGQRKQ